MAGKIPIYEAQVRQAAIPDIGSPGYLNIQDFARSSDGAMLKEVGQELAGIGNSMGAEVIERAKEKTATDLLASNVETEGELIAFDSDFRKNNKGISARYADVAYSNFIDERMAAQKEKFKNNPHALQGLARMEAAMRPRFMARAVAYRDEQEHEYQQDQLRSYHQQTADKWADPGISLPEKQQALAGLETSLRYFAGQRYAFLDDGNKAWAGGKNIDADLTNIRQNLMLGHAQGLADGGQIQAARDYVQANAKSLGGQANLLAERLEKRAQEAAVRAEQERQWAKVNQTYELLAEQDSKQVASMLTSPDGQKRLGLSEQDARQVQRLVNTKENHSQAVARVQKETEERQLFSQVVNLATGTGHEDADPVAAYQAVERSDLDAATKQDIQDALEAGRLNTVDNPSVVQKYSRHIFKNDGSLPETELWRSLASGEMTLKSLERLQNMQKQAQGPQGSIIQEAFALLDKVMHGGSFMDNLPEQATAHLKAQQHIQAQVDYALERGDIKFLEQTLHPKNVRDVGQRYALSSAEQSRAAVRMVESQAEQAEKLRPASDYMGNDAVEGSDAVNQEANATHSLQLQSSLEPAQGNPTRILSESRTAEIKKHYEELETPQQKAEWLRDLVISGGKYAFWMMAETGLPLGVSAFAQAMAKLPLDQTARLVEAAEISLDYLPLSEERKNEIWEQVGESSMVQTLLVVDNVWSGGSGAEGAPGVDPQMNQPSVAAQEIINSLASFMGLGGDLDDLERRVVIASKAGNEAKKGEAPGSYWEHFSTSYEHVKANSVLVWVHETAANSREMAEYMPGLLGPVDGMPQMILRPEQRTVSDALREYLIRGRDRPLEDPLLRAELEEKLGRKIFYETKEEYEQSPYYHPGIEWYPGMTMGIGETLYTKLMEDNARKELLARNNDLGGWAYTALGLGGSIAGEITDPLNLIPMGKGIQAGKAVSGIGKTFLSGVKTAALPAFITSGLGNATRYTLSQGTGRDVSLQEAAENTLMEGALGAGLGGIGNVGKSLLSKLRKLGGSSPTKGRDPALGGDQALSNKTKTSIADASPEAKAAKAAANAAELSQYSHLFNDHAKANRHMIDGESLIENGVFVKAGKFTQAKGVYGCHRADYFKAAKEIYGIKVIVDPPYVNGIKTIKYKILALDKQRKRDTILKTQEFEKTLYDPAVHTDEQMLLYAAQAAEKGLPQALEKGFREFGASSNGVSFWFYIDKNTQRIENFHPISKLKGE